MAIQKKLKSCKDACEREENIAQENSKLNDHRGYKYCNSEIEKIPERILKDKKYSKGVIDKKIELRQGYIQQFREDIERKETEFNNFKRTREKQIENAENEIRAYENEHYSRDKEIEDSYRATIEKHINEIDRIKEAMGIPTSMAYRKKKEEIVQLEREYESMTRMHEEEEQKRARRAKEESQAMIREAERRESQERLIAQELFYKNREAENARKEERWKATVWKQEPPKKVKRVFVPFESLKKKLSEMTEAEFDSIDIMTLPEELADEHERIVDAFIASRQ